MALALCITLFSAGALAFRLTMWWWDMPHGTMSVGDKIVGVILWVPPLAFLWGATIMFLNYQG